ncbi:MAG TPA: hypothetical protein VFK93_05025, partial [Candidatus Limnocylindria bacterium]|nr:hypothetical protein [Candidatus Limnocylindria bacterium]
VRPKVHLSSPRLSVETVRRPVPGTRRMRDVIVPPQLAPHADLVSPWDFAELLRAAPAPLDVMLEAKAKDVALLWLRRRLAEVAPEIAAAEERALSGPGSRSHSSTSAPGPASGRSFMNWQWCGGSRAAVRARL